MLKITAILSLMFIVSSVWSACDSCGSECARACGTRRFRACCFNYLRKKRSDGLKDLLWLGTSGGFCSRQVCSTFDRIIAYHQDVKTSQLKTEVPVFLVVNQRMPELWTADVYSSETHPYSFEDMLENRLE